MISVTVRYNDAHAEIDFPCADSYLQAKLAELCKGTVRNSMFHIENVMEPEYLTVLSDRFIDMDELNYHYGFQTGIELLICLCTGLIIACVLNIFWEFIVVLSVLLPLRAYICGIHMKKFSSCFLCSVVLVTCGPLLAKEIMFPKMYMMLFAVGIMFLLHKIAFVTTGHQSDSEEVIFFARQRRKILAGVFLMILLFAVFDMTGFIKQVFYALSVALFSVIAEVIAIKSERLEN